MCLLGSSFPQKLPSQCSISYLRSALTQVWERLRKELMKRYVQLEEQMAMCYPALQLVPPPQEMEAMCKAAAAAG